MFWVMVDKLKERNGELEAAKLQAQIDRAVREVRAERKIGPRRKNSKAAKEVALA